MVSDFELLDAWRQGDRSAGSQLFDRYFDRVYRFFANKVSEGVDDLIQRTFLACAEQRDAFRKQSSFRTYLFAIARHELYRYWRGRKRDQNLDFNVSSIVDLGPTPSGVVAKHREQQLLIEALRSIPLELQVTIELFYWEGMRGPELAEVLGIPEGTVRSRLRRAREAIAARMTELAESRAVLETTLADFDDWARSLRDALVRDP